MLDWPPAVILCPFPLSWCRSLLVLGQIAAWSTIRLSYSFLWPPRSLETGSHPPHIPVVITWKKKQGLVLSTHHFKVWVLIFVRKTWGNNLRCRTLMFPTTAALQKLVHWQCTGINSLSFPHICGHQICVRKLYFSDASSCLVQILPFMLITEQTTSWSGFVLMLNSGQAN